MPQDKSVSTQKKRTERNSGVCFPRLIFLMRLVRFINSPHISTQKLENEISISKLQICGMTTIVPLDRSLNFVALPTSL